MSKNEFKKIDDQFKNLGIDTSKFEFFDQPNFLQEEQLNPEILNNYAHWVNTRPRSPAYENHVRAVVPEVCKIIQTSFQNDGFTASCVAASSMICRILDRLGVWSYAVAGSTVFKVKDSSIERFLWTIDKPDFPNAFLGHAWVCAPPFLVVDATVSLQNWPKRDKIIPYLSNILMFEKGVIVNPTASDVISAEIRSP